MSSDRPSCKELVMSVCTVADAEYRVYSNSAPHCVSRHGCLVTSIPYEGEPYGLECHMVRLPRSAARLANSPHVGLSLRTLACALVWIGLDA